MFTVKDNTINKLASASFFGKPFINILPVEIDSRLQNKDSWQEFKNIPAIHLNNEYDYRQHISYMLNQQRYDSLNPLQGKQQRKCQTTTSLNLHTAK